MSDNAYYGFLAACTVVGLLIATMIAGSRAATKVHATHSLHDTPPRWGEFFDALLADEDVSWIIWLFTLGGAALGFVALSIWEYQPWVREFLLLFVVVAICWFAILVGATVLIALWQIAFYVMARSFYFSHYAV